MAGFSYAVYLTFVKALFEDYPKIDPVELLSLKTLISTLMLLFWLNVSAKKVLWDDFKRLHEEQDIPEKKSMLALFFCVLYSISGTSTSLASVKQFPLSTVALVNNFAPLFTALMAFYLLQERFTRSELTSLVLCFIGVMFLIAGEANFMESTDQVLSDFEGNVLAYILLIAEPLFVSMTVIKLRQSRYLNPFAYATYANLVLALLCTTIALSNGFHPWNDALKAFDS